MRLEPVRAHRSVDRAVLCGACGHLIAERDGELLSFPAAVDACSRLDVLPAIAECPFCRVPNVFDPRLLNVSSEQGSARIARALRRTLGAASGTFQHLPAD